MLYKEDIMNYKEGYSSSCGTCWIEGEKTIC